MSITYRAVMKPEELAKLVEGKTVANIVWTDANWQAFELKAIHFTDGSVLNISENAHVTSYAVPAEFTPGYKS